MSTSVYTNTMFVWRTCSHLDLPMPAYAHRDIVDEDRVGVYHCIARCVRRAFLAPYRDPPKQASSAENAWLITFAGLRGSRAQSTSRYRALAGE